MDFAGCPRGIWGSLFFFASAGCWAFDPGDVVPADEGIRASGERRTTSDPPAAHRSPNRAEESKLSRPIYRKIILTKLANIFNPEKPNNKFKIPLFSTHSCRMKTNVY